MLLRDCRMLLAEDVFRQPADSCPERHHADRADTAGSDPSGHQEESGRISAGKLISLSSVCDAQGFFMQIHENTDVKL